jgi:hypothetical protein
MCPSGTLPTRNLTRSNRKLNQTLGCEEAASNPMNYGTGSGTYQGWYHCCVLNIWYFSKRHSKLKWCTFHIAVSWLKTWYIQRYVYQRFGVTSLLHIHGATHFYPENRGTVFFWNFTRLYGIISQKNTILISTSTKTKIWNICLTF